MYKLNSLNSLKIRFVIDNGDRDDLKSLSQVYTIQTLIENVSDVFDILDDMEGECRNKCANESDNSCYCEPEYEESKVVGFIIEKRSMGRVAKWEK